MGVIKPLKKPLIAFGKLAGTQSEQLKQAGAFTGPYVAPIDPRQTQALGGLETLARDRMTNNPGTQVKNMALGYLDPNYLKLDTDPTFMAALSAMSNPVNEARADELNRARAVAAGSGAEMAGRGFLQEDSINTNVNRVLSDMTAKATMEEMARRQGIQTQIAPEVLAGAMGLEETPTRLLGEVGGTQRELIQETEIDPARMAFDEQLAAILRPSVPYQNLFGATGVPQKAPSSSSGGGGGSILSSVLGLAGLGMMAG